MLLCRFILGALFLTAPVFSQGLEFHLTETKAEIAKRMGAPKLTASVSAEFESWQFEAEEREEGEFSHYFLFHKKTGLLQGVTRNFDKPRDVDALFPEGETRVVELAAGFKARARKLPDGIWLLAMGSTRAGDTVSQLLLMRDAALRVFYPAAILK